MGEVKIKTILIFIGGIILGFIVGFLIGKIIKYKQLKNERKMSIKRSKSVILGEVYEKIVPFLPNFPYSPKDMVFIGKGIDYLVFDGLSNGELKNIVFLEIKSGKSTLNKNEKMIRDKTLQKKVEYKVYKV